MQRGWRASALRSVRDRRRILKIGLGAAAVAIVVVVVVALGVLPGSSNQAASVLSIDRSQVGRRSQAPAPSDACTRTATTDTTGETDVTAALQSLIDATPDGSVICLAAGGSYRVDGGLHLANRSNLVIDGRGARIFSTARSTVPRLLVDKGGVGVTVRNLVIEGFWPEAGTQGAAIPAFEGNHGISIGGTRDVEIGPDVEIRNVGGDGVYLTAGGTGSTIDWATDVRIHDTMIERTGRMGVSITDGARHVTIENDTFDSIALYVFDIEPNGIVFPSGPAGADDVRFVGNTIGRYGISPLLEPWLFAGTGRGPETDVDVSRNLVTGGALRIGVWDVDGSRRSGFHVTDNWSDATARGPTMVFEGVDGLTVSGNVQPLSSGNLMDVSRSSLVSPSD